MPRSLYWRAALILFVPVVTILLVVSVVFIQRHYEGVTRQMTGNFAHTVEYIRSEIDALPDAEAAGDRAAQMARAFDIGVSVLPAPAPELRGDRIPFYDLNSRIVLAQMNSTLTGIAFVGVIDGAVWLRLDSEHGLLQLIFPLNMVSARNPHQLLVVMLFSGLLMSLVAFVFLKNQMRPIRRLAAAAEAFGRGEIKPYHPSGATEVRAAGQAFLQMRRRIERHIEQRTLMLSGISHDLRTPLTRMTLGLSMMDHEPEARALLSDVRQMESLIDRFLEFARADLAEEASAVDLNALVDEKVAEFRQAGLDVAVAPDPGAEQQSLTLILRPQLFTRALDNVLANAHRYATRARVRLWQEGDSIIVSVEDDGPGIAPRQRAEAMKPFVRLDAARGASDRAAGAGLGLAIVADALRSHGGRLELAQGQSPGLGGLEARLVLPASLRAAPD
ncbi:MAG: two-component system, OmpR family, osmolarity sensor histidine kinase EnvZ [Rhodobacteraceae bacterium HLUCCA12]|nr:MAG: two-component system, OmpR family, osmolarity sensor histidine kinase EnvZ [Rhodobacteraceae bacterium HLUCCA12]